MTDLELRTLGKSKVKVTSLGLGTVPLSGFNTDVSYHEFEATILAGYSAGIRYFDCAPMYGFGKSEHYLGHALRTNGLRQNVVVSTKVGRVLKPASRTKKLETVYGIEWIDPLPFLDTYDYTYDGVMRSFEDSQQRLGLDHIDILLVHDVGRAWHGDQSEFYWDQLRASGYKALDELRSSGAVSAIGLGVNETDSVVGVAREFPIDCSLIAGRYTLLNHAPLEGDFDELLERNVSVIAGGIFNSGILATGVGGAKATYDYGKVPAEIVEKVRAIESVCTEYSVSLPAAAMQFVYAHPAVATLVMGAKSAVEVDQNVKAINENIPSAFWDALKQAKLLPPNAPLPAAG
ncbi:aldo/keto reductase [Mesorhizobium sp.]|uniref:aldo/keto reductase n=1 Tax=Mesorhizobium sp. TaxID=1871066 RepID=UPI000FE72DD0|nr:aldo/keto reductase [Mesorhizobium sp.]RWG04142.1 MAG: aldo/keto reductase [Mesorhizobium sp.]RWH01139.1 MAG: aldo/keto reductase [Mesorhizobium sp.]RWI16644.1 MAG: aldo/keto reductase [Mesorhizobium sp.]RWN07713.1 MAG: aldo/keto reductase [Mesorhizobium sp.]RWN12369.1 MAG: aldo/keto reductase [Mesorhizobium sp.]